MHFEVLVEDASGAMLVECALGKILGPEGEPHTRRIHSYKGIGHLPKGLKPGSDPERRILLDQLPRLLNGYGRSLPPGDAAVIVVVDQDRRDCEEMLRELQAVLDRCPTPPTTLFRLAIEETEAWILGDREALLAKFPKADQRVLEAYAQDSVCNTWEQLADAVYPGGARALKQKGWPEIGVMKCEWAREVGPLIDLDRNRSRSFQKLREGVLRLAGED